MATISLMFRGTKKEKYIHLCLTDGENVTLRTTTGYKIDSKYIVDINKIGQSSKVKTVKNAIEDLQAKIRKDYIELGNKSIVSNKWLKGRINYHKGIIEKKKKGEDETANLDILQDFFTHFLKDYKDISGGEIQEGRIKHYRTLKSHLTNYKDLSRVRIVDINPTWVGKFKTYLKNQDYSLDYVYKIISNFKTLCRYAQRLEVEVSPKLELIKTSYKDKSKPKPVVLSFDELDRIKKLKITNKDLDNSRRWLLLGCELGQRAGDLLRLNEDCITTINGTKVIYLEQEKTDYPLNIPITNKVEELLGNGFPEPTTQQRLNYDFKDICQRASITDEVEGLLYDSEKKRRVKDFYPKYKLVQTHTMRRSFATNYYSKIPTPILARITGHKKEETFLKYVNKPPVDMIDEIKELFNKAYLKNTES